MGFQPTPLSLSLVAAGLGSLLVAYLVWRRPPERGGWTFLALSIGTGLWAVTTLLVETATDPTTAAWWLRFDYAVSGVCVLAWFAFAIEYTGRERRVSSGVVAVLGLEPAVISAVAWSGDEFGVLYADSTPVDVVGGGLVVDHAVAYWVHEVYSTLLLVGGAVVLGLWAYRSRELDAGGTALAVGILAPLAGTVAFAAGLGPDPRPVGFVVATGAFVYAIYRSDVMEITPVAHDTIVENIRDGVFVLDRRDRIVEINPMAKRILGIDEDRVVGRHASEVLSVYPGFYERYEEVNQVQEEIGLDDGEGRRFFHIQVSPLADPRGERIGRLFLVHEITDQKRRQRELRRQNDRLDQFASLVSHDLRNPLNVAEGFTELARDTGDVGYLDRVEDSIGRMNTLIDDVLTLARDGEAITDLEEVGLGDVAAEAWDNVDTREATLEMASNARLRANRDRLLRLYENLFRNAVEHGPDDVRVGVGRLGTPEDSRFGFFVEDDGPGIPERNREAVLEDGFTTSEDGVGLGLSIVTSIVDAHGWTLDVVGSREGGARFEVTGVVAADRTAEEPQPADDDD
jgi:PAS domain S-box-containing protein